MWHLKIYEGRSLDRGGSKDAPSSRYWIYAGENMPLSFEIPSVFLITPTSLFSKKVGGAASWQSDATDYVTRLLVPVRGAIQKAFDSLCATGNSADLSPQQRRARRERAIQLVNEGAFCLDCPEEWAPDGAAGYRFYLRPLNGAETRAAEAFINRCSPAGRKTRLCDASDMLALSRRWPSIFSAADECIAFQICLSDSHGKPVEISDDPSAFCSVPLFFRSEYVSSLK